MDLLFYVNSLIFYYVLFQSTPQIGGWTLDDAWIFVAGFCVVDAVQMTFFSNNVWWLPFAINRGELDYHLVRPVNSLFMMSVREFATNSFINLILASGLLVWAIERHPVDFDALKILGLALMLINGAFLHYILHALTVIPVFWMQSSRGFEEVYWAFSRAMERPDRIFKGWSWRVFTMILPFGLMASVPTRIFLETEVWQLVLQLVVVTLVLFGVLVFCWNRGLRVYGSASS